jgi:3-phenylpropionate/trans-cinnamate dioxygenase ferredoxin component
MLNYVMEYSELVKVFKKVVEIDGHKILVVLLADQVYAIHDRCTHLGASLSKGNLENKSVTCKSHGAKFDLQSGEVLGKAHVGFIKMPTKKTVSYQTKVENGKVYIEL